MANKTKDECNKKSMMNENADKNDQNSGNDNDDDHGEATENRLDNESKRYSERNRI